LAIIGLAIYNELWVYISGLLFTGISDRDYWVRKSNAGGRISKFFVEKKIFYSLHFLLVQRLKKTHIFFVQMIKKNHSFTTIDVNPVTLHQYAFY